MDVAQVRPPRLKAAWGGPGRATMDGMGGELRSVTTVDGRDLCTTTPPTAPRSSTCPRPHHRHGRPNRAIAHREPDDRPDVHHARPYVGSSAGSWGLSQGSTRYLAGQSAVRRYTMGGAAGVPRRRLHVEDAMTLIDNAVYVAGRRTANPSSLDETYELLRERQGMAWIGLYRPDLDELRSMAREFELHHLAVDDAIAAHQRPEAGAIRQHPLRGAAARAVSR